MEVIKENVALLSNFEVLDLVRDIQSGANFHHRSGKQPNPLATITYDTIFLLLF